MEIWKDIEEFDGQYQVSNLGRVKTLREFIPRVIHCYKADGYYSVDIKYNGKRLRKRVHKLVGNAFLDNPNNHQYILHKNKNRFDNRVENIEWIHTLRVKKPKVIRNDKQKREFLQPILDYYNQYGYPPYAKELNEKNSLPGLHSVLKEFTTYSKALAFINIPKNVRGRERNNRTVIIEDEIYNKFIKYTNNKSCTLLDVMNLLGLSQHQYYRLLDERKIKTSLIPKLVANIEKIPQAIDRIDSYIKLLNTKTNIYVKHYSKYKEELTKKLNSKGIKYKVEDVDKEYLIDVNGNKTLHMYGVDAVVIWKI